MDHLEIVPKSPAPLPPSSPGRIARSQLSRIHAPLRDRLSRPDPGGRGPLPLLADDPVLDLLRTASNEELAPLVEILCAKGGATSQLSSTACFRQQYPRHTAYVNDIVADLQKFGGNTIVNHVFRDGRGVPYEEILRDVAKKLKVKCLSGSVPEIEAEIVALIISQAFTKMSPAEQKQLLRSIRVRNAAGFVAPGGVEALRVAIQHSGFAVYKSSVIVANAASHQVLGHGLTLAGNAALTKSIAVFAGPVGLAFTAALLCHGISGPAYRVTVPAVIQIAAIRAARPQIEPTPWERLLLFLREHWVVTLLVLLALAAALVHLHR